MRKRLRILTFIAAVMMLFGLVAVPTAGASGHVVGGVWGTVMDEAGRPMAGVEVWLGIFPGPHNPDFESRYTCTDAFGFYEFHDVPWHHDLISATGPEVYTPEPCANPKFVSPTGFPMLVSFFQGGAPFQLNEGMVDFPDANHYVSRLPTRDGILIARAKAALSYHYDLGMSGKAAAMLNAYKARLDRLVDTGRITGPRVGGLYWFYDSVLPIFVGF